MQRVKPILYRKIYIFHELDAQSLVESLTFRSKTVVCLYVGTSVLPDTVTTLLCLCPRLRKLNLRAGGNSFCHFQTILSALDDLTHLRDLSLNPALLFGTRYVYLPDAAIFHRLTHLDLTTTWTWEAITTGFHILPRLTHLSVSWGSSCTSRDSLRKLLSRDKVKLIVISSVNPLFSHSPDSHYSIVTASYSMTARQCHRLTTGSSSTVHYSMY